MTTTIKERPTIGEQVKDSFSRYKIGFVCNTLGIHRNTLKARIKEGNWKSHEITALKNLGII